MDTEDLVGYVRSNCIDQLVERYAAMFSETSIQQFSDAGMHQLATAWKAAGADERDTLKAFMRLASQNTAAMILSLLDEDGGTPEVQVALTAKASDGSCRNLGRDLLTTFWEQEEFAGRINQTRG
jgi:hypothetical protein